jgi:hypothetical protein
MTALSRPIHLSPERTAFARRVLLHALLLGILGDALLREGPTALGLLVWMLTFAGTVVSLAWRRGLHLTREQCAWLGAAVCLAAGTAWRDAEALQVYNFLAMLIALAVLGATLSPASPIRSVLGTRVRDLAHTLARAATHAGIAVVPLLFGDAALGRPAQPYGNRARALVRAAVITIPLLLLFGALFGQADPVFGSLFSLPQLDFEVLLSHVILAGFFTWVVGGWMRGALVDDRPAARLPDGFPITLGTLEITVALGALNALFALFVGVQIGWLFGGEQLVRSTTGLGYAQYARRGFFELVWVSLLVLPVLLGTRAAIPGSDTKALRRHRRLALPLLLLLGATMVSAFGRMQLYVHYYGLTTDRLFATIFMGWLAIVFVWFAITVLRGRQQDFAAGMAITGFFTLAAVNLANPDALIARVNIGRGAVAASVVDSIRADDAGRVHAATADSPIDYSYLTWRLNGDAAGDVVRALTSPPVAAAATPGREAEVRARCDAVRTMLNRWMPNTRLDPERARRAGDWRSWSLGAARARNAVRANEAALRAVTCWDNGSEVPFGTRDGRPATLGEQWYVAPQPLPTNAPVPANPTGRPIGVSGSTLP